MLKSIALGCFACWIGLAASDARALDRPNVVLIISDDHAWTDYGFMRHERVQTSHIDRLAANGLTFTRGYVTTALCSPSLATLLTGLHPHQHGITGNDPVDVQPREAWLDRFFEHPTLPALLADAGYLTLHTGKYWMRDPARAGFTDSMGETDRHGGQALSIGRETMAPIDELIDKAVRQEQPFFVWYAPFLPHTPHNPPERLLRKYQHVNDPAQAKYFAMVEWLDETVGQLTQMLEEKGVADDTMIVYLADNGWNEFGKSSPYENGVRTPMIVNWPGSIEPRKDESSLVSNIDIVPTILAACGVALPENLPGVNVLDEDAVRKRDAIFLSNFSHDMANPAKPEASLWTRSCILGKWKLIVWEENPPEVQPSNNGWRHKNPSANVELFDLDDDPNETTNLASENAEIVQQLRGRLDAWWKPPEDGK